MSQVPSVLSRRRIAPMATEQEQYPCPYCALPMIPAEQCPHCGAELIHAAEWLHIYTVATEWEASPAGFFAAINRWPSGISPLVCADSLCD